MKPWVKWSLIAFVALIVFGAIFGKDEPNKAVVEPLADNPKAAETNKSNNGDITGSPLTAELLTICEMEVKKSMKDPNSMDKDTMSIKAWEVEKGYRVGFKFDGKNGFGGTVNHTAVCEISKDKKLLAISIE